MQSKVFKGIFFAFILYSLSACDSSGKGAAESQLLCTSGTAPVFSSVAPIFANSCDGCHGHNFSNFANALSSSSQIYSQVTSRQMPQGSSLSEADLVAIQQWVACGSKQ